MFTAIANDRGIAQFQESQNVPLEGTKNRTAVQFREKSTLIPSNCAQNETAVVKGLTGNIDLYCRHWESSVTACRRGETTVHTSPSYPKRSPRHECRGRCYTKRQCRCCHVYSRTTFSSVGNRFRWSILLGGLRYHRSEELLVRAWRTRFLLTDNNTLRCVLRVERT